MNNTTRSRFRTGALLCILLFFLGMQTVQAQAGDTPDLTGAASERPPLLHIVPGLEEPLVPAAKPTAEEVHELEIAIANYQKPLERNSDFAGRARPFVVYLEKHPASPWRLAIQTNLGIGYYHAGYFSRAVDAWRDAWQTGRHFDIPAAKALTDRAAGELARMFARVGDAPELEALFADVGTRAVSGPATETIAGAKEALWMFRNDWAKAYLCGPMALKNLLTVLRAAPDKLALLDDERSGPNGYTLAQVSGLASRLGQRHRLVRRLPGQPVPVPSVIHWKMNHFATIVGKKDGRYHVVDPTFGSGDLWISEDAIDAESSGHFLVPQQAFANSARDSRERFALEDSTIPAGLPNSDEPGLPAPDKSAFRGKPTNLAWRQITPQQAQRIRGMGITTVSQPGATTPNDRGLNDDPDCGMCVVNAKTMVVSLNLNDSPVGYAPPKGPSARIRLSYNQREAAQPANFGFFNVGPKWTFNMMSWVRDDPTSVGNGVLRIVAGGGMIDYGSTADYRYDAVTGQFSPERQGNAILTRIPASGPLVAWELRLPDGGKQVFGELDGATQAPRRTFLTRIEDAHGNALQLNYDTAANGQRRLISLTDATGRYTIFGYGAANPLLITDITDPFGRRANIRYDERGRLAAITDVIGLTSSFAYDAGGLINAMTTPYGTSRFEYGQETLGTNSRFLNITDPLGFSERVEFRHQAPGLDISAAAPPGFFDGWLAYVNTFYWNKHAYALAAGDYNRAHITNWLHNRQGQTSPIAQNTKAPLERRVFHDHSGGTQTAYEAADSAMAANPRAIGRVLDDGSSQVQRYTWNSFGKPLTITDPAGRRTIFTYAANGIDLLSVKRQTATGEVILSNTTYNDRHLPLSHTDAAGQTTRYTYNAAGQLTSTTDALGQTIRRTYDGLGYLTSIVNAKGNNDLLLTYDGFGRVASRTDAQGHTLTYRYDAFDRVTSIGYPDGTATVRRYDRLDLASTTDRLGRTTQYEHDANRRLVRVTDALGRTTRLDYYPDGKLRTMTDARGSVTTWERDIQGRVTAKIHADGQRFHYAYENTTSRLRSITDPEGRAKAFHYTIDDRIDGIGYSGTSGAGSAGNAASAAVTPPVGFTYDRDFPRLASMVDSFGVTSYRYGGVGAPGALQLIGEEGPHADGPLTYHHDALGRIVGRNIGNTSNGAESYVHDALNRITRSTHGQVTVDHRYLGDTDQLTQQRFNYIFTTSREYESNTGDRRLRRILHEAGDGPGQNFVPSAMLHGAAKFGYQLRTGPENRIDRIVELYESDHQTPAPARIIDYTHDAADRLLSAQGASPILGATSHRYDYDAADNLTSLQTPARTRLATYSRSNELTAIDGQTVRSSPGGNIIDDGERNYTWDADNRLTGITYKSQPGKSTRFHYDGLGRRLLAVETGSDGAVAETVFRWCGNQLCQSSKTSQSTGQSRIKHYFDSGENWSGWDVAFLYAKDHLGSVRALVPANSGKPIEAYEYGPYGETAPRPNKANADFRYAGMYYHEESGLYLTRYRAYDPVLGRWLSRDPIEESGGLNLYTYAKANPVAFTDPDGLNPIASAAEGAKIGSLIFPGPGTIVGAAVGAAIGVGIGVILDDSIKAANYPPGYWPGDKGAKEWGRRSGCGADEGKRRFHRGVKQGDNMSGAKDNYGVNPATGDVIDPSGEVVGNLNDE